MIRYKHCRDYLNFLIAKYYSKGMIVDTDILVIYLLGGHDVSHVVRAERKYCPTDSQFISEVLSVFPKKVITTHVLTELSNLSDRAKGNNSSYFQALRDFASNVDETHICKNIILEHPLLSVFGVTDLGMVEAIKRSGYFMFTDDGQLAGYVRQETRTDVLTLQEWRITK